MLLSIKEKAVVADWSNIIAALSLYGKKTGVGTYWRDMAGRKICWNNEGGMVKITG